MAPVPPASAVILCCLYLACISHVVPLPHPGEPLPSGQTTPSSNQHPTRPLIPASQLKQWQGCSNNCFYDITQFCSNRWCVPCSLYCDEQPDGATCEKECPALFASVHGVTTTPTPQMITISDPVRQPASPATDGPPGLQTIPSTSSSYPGSNASLSPPAFFNHTSSTKVQPTNEFDFLWLLYGLLFLVAGITALVVPIAIFWYVKTNKNEDGRNYAVACSEGHERAPDFYRDQPRNQLLLDLNRDVAETPV